MSRTSPNQPPINLGSKQSGAAATSLHKPKPQQHPTEAFSTTLEKIFKPWLAWPVTTMPTLHTLHRPSTHLLNHLFILKCTSHFLRNTLQIGVAPSVHIMTHSKYITHHSSPLCIRLLQLVITTVVASTRQQQQPSGTIIIECIPHAGHLICLQPLHRHTTSTQRHQRQLTHAAHTVP